jgi:hypothetical protein
MPSKKVEYTPEAPQKKGNTIKIMSPDDTYKKSRAPNRYELVQNETISPLHPRMEHLRGKGKKYIVISVS